MLIKALCDYYDIRESAEERIPDELSQQNVSFRIMLTKDGDIAEIVDIRDKKTIPAGKNKTKEVPVQKSILLPKRSQKPGIDLNIIEHRPLYIFGLNYDKKTDTFTPDDNTGKARKSHECFVKGNLEFCRDMQSDIAQAYCRFLEKWIPQEQTDNPELLKIRKEYAGAYFSFGLEGEGLNTGLELDKELIDSYIQSERERAQAEVKDITAVCPVEGEILPVARIHDKISGVRGCSTMGSVLIGINNTAFESYGKVQSYNSNISELAMKKYTQSLNKLLSEKSHRMYSDDTTIIFFALKANDEAECNIFAMMNSTAPDVTEVDGALKSASEQASIGQFNDLSALGADENVLFYVVGLSPNSARISQKFCVRNKFGVIVRNIMQHQADMQVEGSSKQIPIYFITKELISPKSSNDKVPAPLTAALFSAILNGTVYPRSLLETVIRRIKTDSDEENNSFIKMNKTRIGIIKAYLNRNNRKHNQQEEIKMSYDNGNTTPAYLCGSLFAMLEKIQKEAANSDLNRTIKDAYFGSACSKPSVVFPKLLKLSQNHLGKLSYATSWSKKMEALFDKMGGEFPKTLTLEEQGVFIIGYYQMMSELYKSNTDKKAED